MKKPRVATSVLLLALLLCASAVGEAPLETVQRQLNPENTDSTVRGATELIPTEQKQALGDGFRKIDKIIKVEDGVDGNNKTKKLQRKRIATAIRGRKTAQFMEDNIFIHPNEIATSIGLYPKTGKKGEIEGKGEKGKKGKKGKKEKKKNRGGTQRIPTPTTKSNNSPTPVPTPKPTPIPTTKPTPTPTNVSISSKSISYRYQ